MLTLANLTVVALAGTALLGSVAAAPAPQATTNAAITTSQDALVPIITVTETYITRSSLTTATITIYAFSKEEAETIAPHTTSAADDAIVHMPINSFTTSYREPVPKVSAYGPPSSVLDGMPIYTGMPHHHSHGHGHLPTASQSIKIPGSPHPETADDIHTKPYSLATGMPTRLWNDQMPHDTEKPHHKTGKPIMNHSHDDPITDGDAEAIPTVGLEEGTGSK